MPIIRDQTGGGKSDVTAPAFFRIVIGRSCENERKLAAESIWNANSAKARALNRDLSYFFFLAALAARFSFTVLTAFFLTVFF